MIFLFPLEIASCSQIHLETTSCQRLGICLDLNTRNMMDKFMQNFTQLRKTSEISNLLRAHLVKGFPTKLFFLFKTTQYIFRNAFELSQRIQATPHWTINHFSQLKSSLSRDSPTSFEANFKEGSHDSRSWLCDINFINIEGESFKLQFGYVSLKKSRNFGRYLFNCSFHWDRDRLHQFFQFIFFFFPYHKIFELDGHSKNFEKFNQASWAFEIGIIDSHTGIFNIIVWCNFS